MKNGCLLWDLWAENTICGNNAADSTVTTEGLNWSLYHLSLVGISWNTRLNIKTFCFLPDNLFMCFMWISEEAAASFYRTITGSFLPTEAQCVSCAVRAAFIPCRLICIFSVLMGAVRILNTCKVRWHLEADKQGFWTMWHTDEIWRLKRAHQISFFAHFAPKEENEYSVKKCCGMTISMKIEYVQKYSYFSSSSS